jgi:hypothetical protein
MVRAQRGRKRRRRARVRPGMVLVAAGTVGQEGGGRARTLDRLAQGAAMPGVRSLILVWNQEVTRLQRALKREEAPKVTEAHLQGFTMETPDDAAGDWRRCGSVVRLQIKRRLLHARTPSMFR